MVGIEAGSVGIMVIFIALAMFRSGAWADHAQLTLHGASLATFQSGLVLAFFTLGGFESTCTLGEEVRNPTQTIPRAIIACVVPGGLLFLVVIYCFVTLGHAGVIGSWANSTTSPFNDIAHFVGLPQIGPIFDLCIALSFFANAIGLVNYGARIMYSMGSRGLIWKTFGRVHPRTASPYYGVAFYAIATLALDLPLLLAGTKINTGIDYLAQLCSIGMVVFYFLICLALPFYLRSQALLRKRDLAIAGGALTFLLAVLLSSIFPVPPAPYCYFNFIFAGCVIVGLAISFVLGRAVGPHVPLAATATLDRESL